MLGALAAVILAPVITVLWMRRNYQRPPHRVSHTSGTISPGKISAAIVTVMGAMMATGGAMALIAGVLGPGLFGVAAGLALMIFMGPSLTHIHDVAWDAEGIAGPDRTFGPTLGFHKTRMRWEDVESTGKTMTGYWYIKSWDNRKIYWSYLYPGYGRFVDCLRHRRPDVSLPSDFG